MAITAFESDVRLVPGAVAGEDLSSYQYKAVKLSSDLIVKCSSAGEHLLGVLQDAPDASGIAAAVAIQGIVQVVLGGTVLQNAALVVDANSAFVTQSDTQEFVAGTALSAGTAGQRIPMFLNPASSVVTPANAKVLYETFDDYLATTDPVLSENDFTVAPGTTGAYHIAQLASGNRLGYIAHGTQTILGPVGAVGGIDIGGDQTDNDGFEYYSNWREASGRPFVIGQDNAFYMQAKILMTLANGTDDLFVGFKKAQLYEAAFEDYTDVFGLGANTAASPMALKVRNTLNNAATDNTDTTDTIADATALTIKVLVSAAGVCTLQHDVTTPGTLAAPTATAAFTFDLGDQVHPCIFFLQANVAQTGAFLLKHFECGYQ